MEHLETAGAYYTEMGKKNVDGLAKYLHEEVQFKSPVAKAVGKAALLEATKNFTNFFQSLTIRSKFSLGDQAMVVYDVAFPFGSVPTAVLMTFKEDLIANIELFFDARPFEKK
jgi:hypothetical protein